MNELSPSSGEARWSECPDAEAGYRFLSRLCETLGAGSLDRALSEAAAAVNETIGDWCAIWLFDRLSGESRLAAARHREEAKTPAVRNLAEGWLIGRPNGSWRQVMESPRPVVLAIENQAQAREIMGSRERARLASRVGLGSLVAAPLVWSGRRLGLLVIVAKHPQAFADGRGPAFVGEMAPPPGHRACPASSNGADQGYQPATNLLQPAPADDPREHPLGCDCCRGPGGAHQLV